MHYFLKLEQLVIYCTSFMHELKVIIFLHCNSNATQSQSYSLTMSTFYSKLFHIWQSGNSLHHWKVDAWNLHHEYNMSLPVSLNTVALFAWNPCRQFRQQLPEKLKERESQHGLNTKVGLIQVGSHTLTGDCYWCFALEGPIDSGGVPKTTCKI